MAVRLAIILMFSVSLWAQESSSTADSSKTTPATSDTKSETTKIQEKAVSTASGASSTSPAPTKKRNHNTVAGHNQTAPATAPPEQKPAAQPAMDLPDRWQRVSLLVTGAVVLFGLGILGMMWRQTREMKAAREQTERLVRRACDQLEAMRDASEQTDHIIRQLTEQAGIAAEQAKAASMAACAAKTNAENFAQVAGSSVHNVQVAEEAMRLQQRAWLFVTDIRAGELQPGKPLTVSLGFKNTGRTPARNVQIATQVDPLPKGHAPEPRLEKAYSRGIIPPEGTVFVNVGNGRNHGEFLRDEELRAIHSGDLVVWAYGTLTYDDVFEVRQATMFCYRLQPDGRTFAVAEIYNEAT